MRKLSQGLKDKMNRGERTANRTKAAIKHALVELIREQTTIM